MGTRDIKRYNYQSVASIPRGQPNVTTSGGIVVVAGKSVSVNIRTIPDSDRLSLWNFLYSVIVDSTEDDGNGNFAYLWPTGTLLTSAQLNCTLTFREDWATSSDTLNERTCILHIQNNDSSDHTYYVYFKAYSFATTPSET